MITFSNYERFREATLQRLDAQSEVVARRNRRRDALLIAMSMVAGMGVFGAGMLLGKAMLSPVTCPQVDPRA